MNYCTKQDMIDRFGERELIQRTDRNANGVIDNAVLNEAISDAGDEIDGYLTQYTLPLASVPRRLVRIACDIARFNLYQDLDEVSAVKTRYNNAIAYLRDVSKGLVELGVDDAGAEQDEQTVVMSASPERLFGREHLR